jgi:hypothetical protein
MVLIIFHHGTPPTFDYSTGESTMTKGSLRLSISTYRGVLHSTKVLGPRRKYGGFLGPHKVIGRKFKRTGT